MTSIFPRNLFEQHCIEVEEIAAREQHGLRYRLSIIVPTGHRIELYSEMALSDNGPMVRNPQILREESHGMRETPFDPCGALGRIWPTRCHQPF